MRFWLCLCVVMLVTWATMEEPKAQEPVIKVVRTDRSFDTAMEWILDRDWDNMNPVRRAIWPSRMYIQGWIGEKTGSRHIHMFYVRSMGSWLIFKHWKPSEDDMFATDWVLLDVKRPE